MEATFSTNILGQKKWKPLFPTIYYTPIPNNHWKYRVEEGTAGWIHCNKTMYCKQTPMKFYF